MKDIRLRHLPPPRREKIAVITKCRRLRLGEGTLGRWQWRLRVGKKKKGKRGLRDGTRPVAASSTRLTSLRGAGAAAGMLSSFINSGAQTARVRRGQNLPGWICEPAPSKKERGKNKNTHGSISPGACKAHVRVAGGQMSITAGDCKAQPHGFKASYPTLPLLLVCCLIAARRLCRRWMAANN